MSLKCYFCFRIIPTTWYERLFGDAKYNAKVDAIYLVVERSQGMFEAYSCYGTEVNFPRSRDEITPAFAAQHEWALLCVHSLRIARILAYHKKLMAEQPELAVMPMGQYMYALSILREEQEFTPALRSSEELYLYVMGLATGLVGGAAVDGSRHA